MPLGPPLPKRMHGAFPPCRSAVLSRKLPSLEPPLEPPELTVKTAHYTVAAGLPYQPKTLATASGHGPCSHPWLRNPGIFGNYLT